MARPVECHGEIKVTGFKYGNTPWREGKLLFTNQEDPNGKWQCLVYFSANPKLVPQSYSLKNLKCTRKSTRLHLDLHEGTSVIVKNCQMDQKRFDVMVDAVQQKPGKSSAGKFPFKERAVLSSPSENMKTSTPVRPPCKQNNENPDVSPTIFTEVKENQNSKSSQKPRFSNPFEEDELMTSKSPSRFLERSQQKCGETLSGVSTDNFYGGSSASRPYGSFANYSKTLRKPGFLTDPTSKRPRLSLDPVAYSWQKKTQAAQTENKNLLQGFSNLGNTCYMNAILQSLFGLETFAVDLAQLGHELRKQVSLPNYFPSLHRSLCKLLRSKKQQKSPSEQRQHLLEVKDAISKTVKRFSGNEQHDAHEFLCQVLDQLKEEILKVNKEHGSPQREDELTGIPDGFRNPTTMNFEFDVLHTIRCLDCGTAVTKTECFNDLSLEVPRNRDSLNLRSIQDALDLFFHKEQLEYTCESCQSKKAEVLHTFTRLPRVLILHLKRYSFDMSTSLNSKLGQNIVIPKFLTLEPHCSMETMPSYPLCNQQFNGQGFSKYYQSEDASGNGSGSSRRKLDFPGDNSFRFKKTRRPALSDPSNSDSEFESTPKKRRTSASPMSEVLAASRKEHQEQLKTKQDEELALQNAMAQSLNEMKKSSPPKLSEYTLDQVSEDEQLRMAMEMSLCEQNGSIHGNSGKEVQSPSSKPTDNAAVSDFDFLSQITDATNDSDAESGFHGNRQSQGCDQDLADCSVERTCDSNACEIQSKDHDAESGFQGNPLSQDCSCQAEMDVDLSIIEPRSYSLTAIKSTKHTKKSRTATKICKSSLQEHESDNCSCGSVMQGSKSKTTVSEDSNTHESVNKLLSRTPQKGVKHELRTPQSGKKSMFKCKTPDGSNQTLDELDCLQRDKKSKSSSKESARRKSEPKSLYSAYNSARKKSLSCIPTAEDDDNDCSIVENPAEEHEMLCEEKGGIASKDQESIPNESIVSEAEEVLILKEEPSSGHVEDGNTNVITVNENEMESGNRTGGLNISGEEENKENKTPPSGTKSNSASTQEEDPDWLKSHFVVGEDEEEQLKRALEMSLKEQSRREEKEEEELLAAQELSLQDIGRKMITVEEDSGPDLLENLRSKEDQEKIKKNAQTGDLPYSYQLMSVVSHIGSSSSVGHYITDVNDLRNRQWLSFDDSEVSRTTEKDVVQRRQRNGYIFFYLHKDVVTELEEHFREQRKSNALNVTHQNRPASR